MVTINDLIAENTQVALSREVLMLLRWLVEHHADEIKKLTKRALHNGLHDELLAEHYAEQAAPIEETYTDIAYFFGMIEAILIKELDEHSLYKTHAKNLQPIIDRIDSALCDAHIVQASIQHTNAKNAKHAEANPRDALFKEILRQWRPRKSNLLN
jgi:hypothetical protein